MRTLAIILGATLLSTAAAAQADPAPAAGDAPTQVPRTDPPAPANALPREAASTPASYSEPAAPVPLLPAERKLLRTRRV